ncbi:MULTISPECIES: hypothetical protein [unclassified Bradyrhizobium]|uniref:hypothetical protein n=1 Tax=unclassified Bradyrhizobium TaxID=2631580 RepID=UPI001CD3E9B5|nr:MULTISPECIES: hypothetical protein [unclassified Bradyrhizobium]MCA1374328.1 hypothetical protein [Bradyrhizobium sp. IC4060]MCA1484700.1 hypothetical protein [Bradyrhizobium sp. IC4061]
MRTSFLVFLAAVVLSSSESFALPKLEASTRASGVVAFQDENDKTQFYVYPEVVPLVLGLTLSNPSVKYWGIGHTFRQKDPEFGILVPITGGTISGLATITIVPTQEAAIRAAIKKDFGQDNAKLANLDGKTKTIQPVFAGTSIGQAGLGDAVFPTSFRFGSSFSFVVGSPDSHTFASYVAQRIADQLEVTPDSSFSINLVAESQFRGPAWTTTCSADLAQVWKDVRQRYGGSGGYGWLGISVDYQSIQQDLFRSKKINCDFSAGDLDSKEKGDELFQIAKDALTSINSPDNEFFRFQPNPQAATPGGGGQGPWLISLNLAYSSAALTQKIEWRQTFTFNPTVLREMPTSLTLAVKCDINTEQYFKELDTTTPCITATKARFFQDWADREARLKTRKMEEIMVNPRLSDQQRKDLVRFYSRIALTDANILVASKTISDADTQKFVKDQDIVSIGLSPEFFSKMEEEVSRGRSIKDALGAIALR